MKRFNSADFKESFRQVGLQEGDTLLVHNSLLKFGVPTDIPLGQLSEVIYESLIEVIGSSGTIAVPTFNFDFCKGIAFHRQKTPSKGMGIFSEYIRTLPTSLRSSHPMQSLAVNGPLAEQVVKNDTQSSFEPGGAFDVLLQNEAKLLLLGAAFNSASMIHWVEEKLEVPYRYWKTFVAEYTDGDDTEKRYYQMYVRSLELDPTLKLYPIEDELIKHNKLKQVQLGGGMIKCFLTRDFVDVAGSWLRVNPYYFVSNHMSFLQL